jgi:pantoate--beta-alanine ligase
LPAALQAAAALAARGERSAQMLLDAARGAMRPFEVEPEYIALVEPETLEPLQELAGEALLAIAARVGEVRLIDNAILAPADIQTISGANADDAPPTLSQPLQGKVTATCSA